MKLEDKLDDEIIVMLSAFGKTETVVATLRGVEAGGIWLEQQMLTDRLLETLKQPHSGRTPVIFFPYHAIVSILDSIDKVSISRKSYGV